MKGDPKSFASAKKICLSPAKIGLSKPPIETLEGVKYVQT